MEPRPDAGRWAGLAAGGRNLVLLDRVCVLGQVTLSLFSSLGLEIASSLTPAAVVTNAALIYIYMLNIVLVRKE